MIEDGLPSPRRGIMFTRGIYLFSKWSCIALVSVLFCEFSLRVWDFWPVYQLTGKGIGGGKGVVYFTPDPELLFRMLPNKLHSINADGFRDDAPTRQGNDLVVVVGDSFPMGLAVQPDETFPQRLEALMAPREVYNMGVQGYGPDQALIAFKKYGATLKPSTVILSLYPSNDFNDLVKNNLLEPSQDSNSVTRIHPNPIERILPRWRLSMAYYMLRFRRFLPAEREEELSRTLFNDKDSDEKFSSAEYEWAIRTMRSILTEFARMSKEDNFELVGVIIPSFKSIEGEGQGSTKSLLDQEMVAICRETSVSCLDLNPRFQSWQGRPLYLPSDRHLSAQGHSEVAQAIFETLHRASPDR